MNPGRPGTELVAPLPLNRSTWSGQGALTSAIRIVHIGLGAFHRPHQAYFTQLADTAKEWGIAAFTGRSPKAAEELARQDCLFTLLERSAAGDRAFIIDRIVESRDGANLVRFCELLAAPETAVVTLTLTEAGYRVTPDGDRDLSDPAVVADLELLPQALLGAEGAVPETALARLVVGLDARRRRGSGSIAVVPCDNLPSNGSVTRRAVLALARRADPATAEWVEDNVSFVSTSVDRITPRLAPDDVRTATDAIGWLDQCPVVAEPFAEWILSGDFPAGRPHWELAGARFVDDIAPFEQRKLRMLNGAHTLLATAGRLLGHQTVAAAAADPVCAGWLREYWAETAAYLPGAGLELGTYQHRLMERFLNPRIEHRLSQIAEDTPTKLRLRIVPTLRAARAAGVASPAAARAIAAWILENSPRETDATPVTEHIRRIAPELATDAPLLAQIRHLISDMEERRIAAAGRPSDSEGTHS